MHNLALRRAAISAPAVGRPQRSHLSATHLVRAAAPGDVGEIHALVSLAAESGLVLPRSADEVALAIDDYVTVTDGHDRVLACAALQEYSPSLAEVGSVVVDESARGLGLGSIAVRGVEAVARRRGVRELFALTLAERFFESLGYERTAIARYPEKLRRYEELAARGVDIVPKRCYRKVDALG